MKTGGDRMAAMQFDFELGDPSHLGVVLGAIRAIDGVYESYRVLPGSASGTG
jgi:GTP pyrophosphokinase